MTKKQKRNFYNFHISVWKREMELIESSLFSLELDRAMDKQTRDNLAKVYKNRIKRCKYNITRSKNLKNKI
jgi:hypothetical protein